MMPLHPAESGEAGMSVQDRADLLKFMEEIEPRWGNAAPNECVLG